MRRNPAAIWMPLMLLAAALPARADLMNGSFESPVLASNTFCINGSTCPTIDGWTGGFYVINGSPGPITPMTPLPDGVQFAMIQATGTLDQTVNIGVADSYQLSWADAGRAVYIGASGNESYDVLFDGNLLGSFSTTSNSAWTTHSVTFSSGTGNFTLEIAGKTPFSVGDNSVLLDNFVLAPFEAEHMPDMSQVPEPRALSVMVMGLFLLGGWLRRTRNRAAA
jgi:hypothetical protein